MVGHDRTNLTDGYGGPQDPDILLDPNEVAICIGERIMRRMALVAAWTVLISPFWIPKRSSSTFATGARQLVVQEALEST